MRQWCLGRLALVDQHKRHGSERIRRQRCGPAIALVTSFAAAARSPWMSLRVIPLLAAAASASARAFAASVAASTAALAALSAALAALSAALAALSAAVV